MEQTDVPPESPLGGSLSLYVISGQQNEAWSSWMDVQESHFLLYLCFNFFKKRENNEILCL